MRILELHGLHSDGSTKGPVAFHPNGLVAIMPLAAATRDTEADGCRVFTVDPEFYQDVAESYADVLSAWRQALQEG